MLLFFRRVQDMTSPSLRRRHISKDEYDFEGQDSDVEQTGESSDVHIKNRGKDTIKNDVSDQDSEDNFKHHGCKKMQDRCYKYF